MTISADALREKLFRKVAVDRLSSPDQLDHMLEAVSLRSWIALAPLAGLVVIAILWGFLGSIPTKVSGKAVLIPMMGLADVTSGFSGRVVEIKARVGDRVERGQAIASLAQPDLEDRIRAAEGRLSELEAQEQALAREISRSAQLNRSLTTQQRAAFEAQIAAARERSRVLRELLATRQQLMDQGLITRQALLQTQNDLATANLEVENIRGQIQQLSVRGADEGRRDLSEITAVRAQISETLRSLSSLRSSFAQQAEVASAYAGRVVEIKSAPGAVVSPGTPILTVEPSDSRSAELEAVIFIPATDGKNVAVGMRAQVVPSTVKREEFGFMVGAVRYVSEYAATAESMHALLQNQQIVKDLAGAAPPIEVRVSLQRANTASGFAWSSDHGPPYAVRAGTLGNAEIVVRTQPPASLVLPILKKSLGLD